jgi:hypothetical protein
VGLLGIFLVVTSLVPEAQSLRNRAFVTADPALVTGSVLALGSYLAMLQHIASRRNQRAEGSKVETRLGRAELVHAGRRVASGTPPDVDDEIDEDIVEDALAALCDIRFQQSYSSGWSGALKLPVGLEGGVNATMSLAQMQMSLPEIAARFRRLVGRLARHRTVLIGIDEIDKIGDVHRAESFLNDLKLLFGVRECYFLISVSQDAMSSFQLRGVPFRDAFDSALDEILPVPYLNLAATARLVHRRVVGLSAPFLALTHSLSGGLPRDAIRIVRRMVRFVELAESERSLEAIARRMVRAELRDKVVALTVAAGSIQRAAARSEAGATVEIRNGAGPSRRGGGGYADGHLAPDGATLDRAAKSERQELPTAELAEFLWELDRLTATDLSEAQLLARGDELRAAVQSGADGRLDEVRLETATLMLFYATVVGVFKDDDANCLLRGADGSADPHGVVGHLSLVRQSMTADVSLAWQHLMAVRESLDRLRSPD